MDELELEFFRAMNLPHIANGQLSELAKAAASLCREKCKEAIKLARQVARDYGDADNYINTEQEILDTLNKKP